MRQPNLQKALATINGLIAEEPNNPYFYEVRGQIYVSMAKPAQAIPDYQKSVNLRPRAATAAPGAGHRPARHRGPGDGASPRCQSEGGALVEDDDRLHLVSRRRRPTACSRTSRWPIWPPPSSGTMSATCSKALVFATRARGKLPQGSADWQRASDIRARPPAAQTGGQAMRPVVITLAGAVGGAMLAVAIILTMAQNGLVPINDRQMQTYLMLHPGAGAGHDGAGAGDWTISTRQAAQAAAMQEVGHAAFFDPNIAFRHRPGRRQENAGGILRL